MQSQGQGKPAPAGATSFDDWNSRAGALTGGVYNSTSAATAGSAASPNQQSWMVYLGPGTPRRTKFTRGTTNTVTTEQAMGQFYNWNDSRLKKWGKTLEQAGILKPGEYGWDELKTWWTTAVEEAGNIKTLGNRNITPEQWVKNYANGSAFGGPAAPAGPVTTTRTDTTTQHFDDLDARAMANEVYTGLLGKAASGKQSQALQAALNAYAENHPQITTQRQTVQPNGDVAATSSTRGGITAAGTSQIAEDRAKAAPDYAEYQAATTYFNALQQALGPTADV